MRRFLVTLLVSFAICLATATSAMAYTVTPVTGHVYDMDTGKPVANSLFTFWGLYGGDGGVFTDASGGFTVSGISGMTGTMQLCGSDIYRDDYFGQSTVGPFAALIVSGPSGASGVDFFLDRHGSGTIAGHVVDSDGRPLPFVRVVAYKRVPLFDRWVAVPSLAVSGARGEYSISDLEAGVYRLGVSLRQVGDPTVWLGGPSVQDAADVAVAVGQCTGPEIIVVWAPVEPRVLPPAHTYVGLPPLNYTWLYGKVISASTGQGVDLGNVSEMHFYGAPSPHPFGDYKLMTKQDRNDAPAAWPDSGYFASVWDSQRSWDTASLFNAGMAETFGLNLIINQTGTSTITGRVVNASGRPAVGASVEVLQYSPKLDIWDPVETAATTDGSGQYSISGICAGTYRVVVPRDTGQPWFYSEDAAGIPQAVSVEASASATAPTIALTPQAMGIEMDPIDTTPSSAVTLSGVVRNQVDRLPAIVHVTIERSANGGAWASVGEADAPSGRFSISVSVPSPGAWFRAVVAAQTDSKEATSAATHVAFADATGGTSLHVWRFYNLLTGTHFYTADPVEKNHVFNDMKNLFSLDGVAYSVCIADPDNATVLWRFFNLKTGTHFYTADLAEKARIQATMSSTYRLDGPAYNVSATNVAGSTTVWRFYNFRTGTHFYTADAAEKASVLRNMRSTYSLDGPGFYLAP